MAELDDTRTQPPVEGEFFPHPPPDAAPARRSRRGPLVLVAAGAVVVLALVLVASQLGIGFSTGPSAAERSRSAAAARIAAEKAAAVKTGTDFLRAWERGSYSAMQDAVLDPRDDMTRIYKGMAERLGIEKVKTVPGQLLGAVADPRTIVSSPGATVDIGDDGTVPPGPLLPFDVTVTLDRLGDVRWTTALHLTRIPEGWKVAFTADTVYPRMTNGQRLALEEGASGRGSLLDRHGDPLDTSEDLTANLLGKVTHGKGTSGLQRVLDETLGGHPGADLAVVDASSDQVVELIQSFEPEPGKDVETTIDLKVQRAAEKALARADGRAGLVAIDTRTGEVRALANHPVSGLPMAINSRSAPGSTFKIITAAAALDAGRTPSSTVRCPATLTVGGKKFRNHEVPRSTSLSLTSAFAQSCNTSFIDLQRKLPDAALPAAAKRFGFGIEPLLPIASRGGSFPETDDPIEAAAAAIGQGKVESSPLHMASVAAAVASGTWRQPRVLEDCDDCASFPIPEAPKLRTLMRAVVTSGTGSAVRNTPGGAVYGKTGTPEVGSGDPPPTNAWFVGWQGHLAFAVFVEGGEFGGTVAAPIADRFLRLAP